VESNFDKTSQRFFHKARHSGLYIHSVIFIVIKQPERYNKL